MKILHNEGSALVSLSVAGRMNKATRPVAILKPFNNNNNNLKFAFFFHSTPVLDRKRRTHWNYCGGGGGGDRDSTKRYNRYTKRCRNLHSKEELLRNVGVFAEQLFENWRAGYDDKDRWFRRDFDVKNPSGGWRSTKGPYSTGRRGFSFCDNDDDSDVETIFRGSFGGAGPQFFFFPFGSRGSNNFKTSWSRSDEDDDDDDDASSESDCSKSDRRALGLCPSGPLKIEDVKNAYRVCALKWHPDRHAGKTKAVAEEKFKACSAAYQSLCDKLSPA